MSESTPAETTAEPLQSKRWVRVRQLTEWGRTTADSLPWVGHLIHEWRRVEVVDRSLAIGAQGLLALLPMLVVITSLVPDDIGSTIGERFSDSMGLTGDSATVVNDTLNQDVSSTVGWIGAIVTLITASSFARAMQRMHARVHGLSTADASGWIVASMVWLAGFLAMLAGLTAVAWVRDDTGIAPTWWWWGISLGLQVLFWWWSAHVLLLGLRPYRTLLPGAVLAMIGTVALASASDIFMPPYTSHYLDSFGAFGLVLAIATWLIAFAGALVLAAGIGRLLTTIDYPPFSWFRYDAPAAAPPPVDLSPVYIHPLRRKA
jgi:membrane protein